MAITEWTAVILCVIAILTAVYSAMRFITKAILLELRPNSGASLKDQVNRIEQRLDHVYTLLLKED
jgi:hypothetical protein